MTKSTYPTRLSYLSRLCSFFVAVTVLAYQVMPADIALANLPESALTMTSPIAETEVTDVDLNQENVTNLNSSHDETFSDAPINQAENNNTYDRDEYDFEDALDLLRPDYASAVIVKSLTADNLRQLVAHDVEVGIAVFVDEEKIAEDEKTGKIVLFTGGSAEEIRMNMIADGLLNSDSNMVIAHAHLRGTVAEPSTNDIAQAARSGRTEYLVSEHGIYVYDGNGKINDKAYDYGYLVREIQKHHNPNASTVATRRILNDFIVAIDEYNENKQDSITRFSEPVTILPGGPILASFDVNANISITRSPNDTGTDPRVSIARVGYSTSNHPNGSFGGLVVNFGAAGANLNSINTFSFDLRSNNNTSSNCPNAPANNCFKIEFKDTSNRTATAFVAGVTNAFQQFDISKTSLLSSEPLFNFNAVKEIVFVIEHFRVLNATNGFLDVKLGGVEPQILKPDANLGVGDIVPLPLTSQGIPLAPIGLTNTSTAVATSKSEVRVTYNGAANEFGGTFMSYDDSSTTNTIETGDLTTNNFPNGLVVGLKLSDNDVSQVKFEVTLADNVTKKSMILGNVPSGSNFAYYRIPPSMLGTVAVVAFVLEGAASTVLDIQLGTFNGVNSIDPTVSNTGLITKLPPLMPSGGRPALGTFATTGANLATVGIVQASETFATVGYTGSTNDSLGGWIVSLDDPTTNDNNPATITDVETRKWDDITNANNELVIFFNSVVSTKPESITEFLFEVQTLNADGTIAKDQVRISNLQRFGQGYVLKKSDFAGLDFDKVLAFAGVFTGTGSKTLMIDWGNFDITNTINPTGGITPANVTKLDPHASGIRPSIGTFATTGGDLATVVVDQTSETFATVTYNGSTNDSLGGWIVSLDDPATNDNNAATFTDVEVRTWASIANANDEIVILFESLGNGNAGHISDFLFEVQSMDTNGVVTRDQVKINNLTQNGQGYVLRRQDFFGIDFNRIAAFAGVFTGTGNQVMKMDWGNFDITNTINPTGGITPANVTKLDPHASGIRPSIGTFATTGGDLATVVVDQTSETFATVTYNGSTNDSLGGWIVSLDDPATNDNNAATFTDVEVRTWASIANANDEIVILFESLGNGNAGHISDFLFEVQSMDTNGVVTRDQVKINNLTQNGQGYVLRRQDFFGIDFNRIAAFAGVFTGTGNQVMKMDWGNFDITNTINPTGGITPANVTKLDPHASGIRPSIGTFATTGGDLATVVVDQTSETFATVTYNGSTNDSLGGWIVSLDDPATNDNNAATFTDVEVRTWASIANANDEIVILFESLGNGNAGHISDFLFEVQSMDTNGVVTRDQVKINNLTQNGQGYVLRRQDFFGIDFNRIAAFAGVFTGTGNQVMKMDWGNFDITNTINPTGGITPANVTKLDPHASGIRPSIGTFATTGGDLATVVVDQTSETFATVTYNGSTNDSLGGWIVSLDDPATNDNNAATFTDVEVRTWASIANANDEIVILFESLGNGNAGHISDFLFEVQSMDTNGVVTRDQVKINNLTQNGQGYVLRRQDFFGIDFNRIAAFAGVFTGTGNQVMKMDWGNFDITNTINPTGGITPANVTKLDPHASGIRPSIGTFATTGGDLATVVVDQTSETFATVTYNGSTNDSLGGWIVSLDDPATNDNNAATFTDVEVRTWASIANANDEIVILFESLGNGNAGHISDFLFEVQSMDTNGVVTRDQVKINNLTQNGQGYVLRRQDFFGIDFNRIAAFAGVFTGTGNQVMKMDWGNFDITNTINPTGGITPANVTKLDPHASGIRPSIGTFATTGGDLATVVVDQTSETFATVTYNGSTNDSLGGWIVSLDDPATNDNNAATFTDVEVRTWASIANANDEIVILFESLGNGNAGHISDFLFEVQSMDTNGVVTRDQVKINNLTQNGQGYVLRRQDFFGIDFNRIAAFAGVFTGTGNQVMKMDWGNFDITNTINPTGGITPANVTKLDPHASGIRPSIGTFATTGGDLATVVVDQTSETFATVTYNGSTNDSLGGWIVSLDDPATNDNNAATFTDVEVRTWASIANANDEIVILFESLGNGNAGHISDFLFEVQSMDTNGVVTRDQVKINNLTQNGQGYVLRRQDFFGIDFNRIAAFAGVFTGTGNQVMKMDWGNFDITNTINPTGGITPANVTKLDPHASGIRPSIGTFATTGGDLATVVVDQTSETFATVTYNGSTNDSLGGWIVSLDDPATNDNNAATFTDVEVRTWASIANANDEIVILFESLGNGNAGHISDFLFEVQSMDTNGVVTRDQVKINNLTQNGQGYVLRRQDFFGIDFNRIAAFAGVFTGTGNQVMKMDWGNFDITNTINPTGGITPANVTKLDPHASGIRPSIGTFATTGGDLATVVVDQTSETFATVTYNGSTNDSLGGWIVSLDDPATNDNNAATFTDVEVRTWASIANANDEIVILFESLGNGNAGHISDFLFEVQSMDTNGVVTRDQVKINNLTQNGQGYVLRRQDFFGIDFNRIAAFAGVFTGTGNQVMKMDWGNFDITNTINPTGGITPANVTKLDPHASGIRPSIGTFATTGGDLATVVVDQTSETFATVTYNGSTNDSLGGWIVSLDDPATNDNNAATFTDVEVRTWASIANANDEIVILFESLGNGNAGHISDFLFEVQSMDTNGVVTRDQVKINNLTQNGQGYVLRRQDFFGIDFNRIAAFAGVFTGTGNQVMKMDWGNFDITNTINPTGGITPANVTKLDPHASGIRPSIGTFATTGGDLATVVVDQTSETFATVTYNGSTNDSLGGWIVSLDDPATNDNNAATFTDVEVRTWASIANANDEIVILFESLGNGNAGHISDFLFEVQSMDTNGVVTRDQVKINNLTQNGQGYVLRRQDFFGIDFNRIAAFAGVFTGTGNQVMKMDWGNFDITNTINPTGGITPANVTKLDPHASGIRPSIGTFATTGGDLATVVVDQTSETFATVTYNGSTNDSLGGWIVSLDDPATNDNNAATFTDVEVRTWASIANANDEIVILFESLGNGNAGHISDFLFEVQSMDTNGVVTRDQVKINNLTQNGQGYVLRRQDFFGIDFNRIAAFAGVFTGTGNQVMKMDWGNFDITNTINPTGGITPANVTKLDPHASGIRPSIGTFATTGGDLATVVVDQTSETFATVTYNGSTNDSLGGWIVSLDDPATNDNNAATFTDVEVRTWASIANANDEIVILFESLGNGNAGHISDFLFEVQSMDTNGVVTRDQVKINNLTQNGQGYVLRRQDFFGIDFNRIAAFAGVFTGTGNQVMKMDWGNFDITNTINPTGGITPANVTKLDPHASGIRPSIGTFATTGGDLATVVVDQTSETFATVTYNGSTNDSLGGWIVSLDDPATNDNNAATFTDVEVRTWASIANANDEIVILFESLGNGNAGHISDFLFEVQSMDTNGVVTRDQVKINNLTQNGQGYVLRRQDFFGIDFNRIAAFAGVFTGTGNQVMKMDWGNFDITNTINPTGGITPANVTKLDPHASGIRPSIGTFATTGGDLATVVVDQTSETFATVTYNGSTNDSLGGWIVSLDDPATNDNNAATFTDVEVRTWASIANANDEIVILFESLGNGNAGHISDFLFEVQSMDTNGVVTRDQVKINNLTQNGQGYVLRRQDFFGIDFNRIAAFAGVFTGTGNQVMKMDWGNFDITNTINPTGTDTSLITKIPPYVTSGLRPAIETFATENADAASVQVIQASETFTTFVYDGTTNDSLGGFLIKMDDPGTNDNDPNTTTDVETRNWDDIANAQGEIIVFFETLDTNTVPPVDVASSSFLFEVQTLDSNGTVVRDQVSINNLTTTGQGYAIKKQDFHGLDFTKVVAFAGVFLGPNKQGIRMDWGNFDVTKQIAPTVTDTNLITKLPLVGGVPPALNTFATEDPTNVATVNVSQVDSMVATVSYNGTADPSATNTGSLGGWIVSLDDPATNDNNAATFTDVETRRWDDIFTNANNELVLFLKSTGNGNAGHVSEFLFEVQTLNADGSIARDQVLITGLTANDQGYVIKKSDFFGLDFDKVLAFAGVFIGAGDKITTINWGNFATTLEIQPDQTNGTITPVPTNSLGARPTLTPFASNIFPNGNKDFSKTTLDVTAVNEASVRFQLFGDTSFGGVFVDYDDPATNDNNPATFTDVEGINFHNAFPASGLVLSLRNPNGGISDILFEVTDITGKRDQVKLTGITNVYQTWTIDASKLDEVDLTNVKTLSLVLNNNGTAGLLHLDNQLDIRLGDWSTAFNVTPDGTNQAITPLPETSTQELVTPTSFASDDFSKANLAVTSQNELSVNFQLWNTTSFGGVSLVYDNGATNDNNPNTTTDIETINMSALYPNGFTLEMNNGGSTITDVVLELTDIDGKRDRVVLNGITNTAKTWTVALSQFDEIDTTKIQSIVLLKEGRLVNQGLNVKWGPWVQNDTVNPDGTNQAITPLPETSTQELVTPTSFATQDFSKANLSVTSQNELSVNFQLWNTTSFGGVSLVYDNGATNDNDPNTTTDIETINMTALYPNGFTLEMNNGGSTITDVVLELTDIDGKRDRVTLSGITNTAKTWTIMTNQFQTIDTTKIQSIVLLKEGRLVNQGLNVKWGPWVQNDTVNPDGTNQAITPLPETSTQELVTPTSFATQDFSKANLTVTNQNELSVNFQLWNTTSFGGVSLVYDNGATNDNDPNTTTDIETINMNALYPNGFTLEMNNGGSTITDVVLELTDIDGKRDRVVLNGITNTAKTWTIMTNQFQTIDTTKIQSIVLLKEGRLVNQGLNVKWGPWRQNDTINPDATNQAITPLPEFNGTQLVTPSSFATQDHSKANMTVISPTELSLNFQLWNTTSFAGVALVYDNGATNDNDPNTTTDIETVNLDTKYPNGFTFQMDNGGSTITDVVLELTDINGKRDRVILNGITNTAKTWTIMTSQFQEVDTTQIQSIVLLKEGRVVDQALNVKWGDWVFVPSINGATYDPSALTTLNNTPGIFAGGSQNAAGNMTGFINVEQKSNSKFEYDYVLTSDDSFVFSVITAGGFDSGNIFQGTRLNLPENLVIAARASSGTMIRVEVKDINHRVANFDLVIDKPILQNFTLQLSGNNIPTGFDRANVAEIIFVNTRANGPTYGSDLVQVEVKGLNFAPTTLPQTFLNTKADLLDKGTDYFQDGKGIDPVTGFPFDRSNGDGTFSDSQKFTQPTLIGFLGEMYGQAISGRLNLNLMTTDEALNKANALMDSLLNVQTNHGWNGLLPWLDLDPVVDPSDEIGLGDNANLALSLVTMVGSIEQANSLTVAQQAIATAITNKVNTFLNNQENGYKAFVHPTTGIFQAALKPSTNPATCINTNTCVFNGFVDRLNTEFRAGFVLLAALFPNSVPKTVITNLMRIDRTFTDEQGGTYRNIISFEGGAFQTTWNLRGNERDFNGFRTVQLNNLSAQLAYARDNYLPGILSASDVPNQDYFGLIGLPDVAESSTPLYFGAGSTYALASAFSTDPFTVLNWLTSISQQLPGMMGPYGLYDSATSNSEIAQRYFGIDIATTILGLSDAGPAALVNYLRNRNMELAYNTIYEEITPTNIFKTASSGARPPEFADRSLSVFNVFSSEGVINDMPVDTTTFTGVRFAYANLASGFAGRIWDLPNTYDAAANKVNVFYSVTTPPDMIKVEFKDAADNTVFAQTFAPVANARYEKMSIDLPNDVTKLGAIKKVVIIAEDNDAGDFFIHAIDLKHLPSSQNLAPNGNLTSGDVTSLPGTPQAQFFGTGSLSNPSANVARVNFDVTGGGFAGVSYNFDPTNNGTTVDLSATSIIFGLTSDKAKQVKIEVDDMAGARAVLYATSISTTEQYYEFLKTLVQSGVDLTKVKKINFVVDQSSVAPGDETGTLDVLLGGATF